MNHKNYAIGVFDSGLGGLTVVKEIIRHLPGEDIVYFGDTARVPYGTKSKEAIVRFSIENASFLMKQKVKMIVVACNSSSSFAIPSLRKKFDVPIIGVIEPGCQKAVSTSLSGRIGVIATSATIQSNKYERILKQLNKRARVVNQPCPLFVPLAEEGWFDRKVTFDIAKDYLWKIKKAKADVLILGCTHYPLLKNVIAGVLGRDVYLVDSAKEVAAKVERILKENNLSRTNVKKGRCRAFVSDKPQHFKRIAKRFLGYNMDSIRKV